MLRKLFLSLALPMSLFFVSCKDNEEIAPKEQMVSGNVTLTQKSFTPTTFENGQPTKAKIVQELNGTLNQIGSLTATLNVDFDLVNNKSGEVLATYVDKDGNKIYTTSSSVANATGLSITEKITGGTGKFANIKGGGAYFINLNFTSGNGSGTLSWTVTY